MVRLRKIAYWAGGALAVYAVAGFLIAPPIVRGQLEHRLTELLGRQVAVEKVALNPFALTASIRGFKLKEPDGTADAVSFDALGVNVAWSSIFGGVVVESVQLAKPQVRIARGKDGKYSFQDIIDRLAGGRSEAADAASSPRFAVYNIELSDGRIEFDDQPEKAKHTISDLQVGLPFVSSLPSEVDVVVQPRLSARVNGTPFEITGETRPFKDTREAFVRIDIDDLEVAKYLEYSPVPLRIRVPSGRLSTRLILSYAAGQQLQTFALSGSANLQQLAIRQADGAPLATLGKVTVELDALDLVKRSAAIGAIRIEGPEVDVVRQKDGTLNLQNAFPRQAPKPTAPSSSERPFALNIANVSLRGGQVRFVDRTTEKPVQLSLNDLALSLTGLSNAPDSRADLKLNGRVNKTAPLEVTGKVNLLSPNLAVDLQAVLQNIDLVPMSPYSGMYAGYAIDRGKLSLKHAYTVQDRKLAGKNSIRLEQFTFGRRIDSPTATKLPVALAVSLLKDRNGVIELDLPVSASLDDPNVGGGQLLRQETESLLGKAGSSPFALLGEQVGSKEDLSYLEFAPASAALDEAAQAKLKLLAKALYERPGLRLDIGGRADPEADRAELKRAAAERRAKAAKKDEESGEPIVPEADLRRLAEARAQAARNWLVENGKLSAERVALIDPAMRSKRVEFGLR